MVASFATGGYPCAVFRERWRGVLGCVLIVEMMMGSSSGVVILDDLFILL